MEQITNKEKQILDLIQMGATSYTIKIKLGVKRCTVRTYCKKIYKKFGVRSKQELREVLNGIIGNSKTSN